MSNYIADNLQPKEKVIHTAKGSPLSLIPTWVSCILWGILTLVFIVVDLASTGSIDYITFGAIVILCIDIGQSVFRTVRLLQREIAITDQRLFSKVGSTITDFPFTQIQKVTVTQSFVGKIFKYFDVSVQTTSTTVAYNAVKNAEDFKRILDAQVEKAKAAAAEQENK